MKFVAISASLLLAGCVTPHHTSPDNLASVHQNPAICSTDLVGRCASFGIPLNSPDFTVCVATEGRRIEQTARSASCIRSSPNSEARYRSQNARNLEAPEIAHAPQPQVRADEKPPPSALPPRNVRPSVIPQPPQQAQYSCPGSGIWPWCLSGRVDVER